MHGEVEDAVVVGAPHRGVDGLGRGEEEGFDGSCREGFKAAIAGEDDTGACGCRHFEHEWLDGAGMEMEIEVKGFGDVGWSRVFGEGELEGRLVVDSVRA